MGSNPSHLIKSNILHEDVRQYCKPNKWCSDGNSTKICPLYAAICNKTNPLCLSDKESIDNVRIEQGVPGLKNLQIFGEKRKSIIEYLFLFTNK